MDEYVRRTTSQLSGGQQQRVAIARAVVMNPDLLLADEPTGALDTSTAEEIMSVFKRLNKNGTTIIIVTHNPLIADNCDRKYVISDGRIQ
jgi:putative ABC transport system ATP-binding protein